MNIRMSGIVTLLLWSVMLEWCFDVAAAAAGGDDDDVLESDVEDDGSRRVYDDSEVRVSDLTVTRITLIFLIV